MTLFWDRQGVPIEDVIEWATKFEDSEYRIVAVDQDAPGTPMVSTIWQGMDLSMATVMHPNGIPAIFETAYLVDGAVVDKYIWPSEASALEGHAMMVREFLHREPLPNGGLKSEILGREKEIDGRQE